MKTFKQFLEDVGAIGVGPTNTVSGVAGLGVPVNGDQKQAEPSGPKVVIPPIRRRKYKNFMGKT